MERRISDARCAAGATAPFGGEPLDSLSIGESLCEAGLEKMLVLGSLFPVERNIAKLDGEGWINGVELLVSHALGDLQVPLTPRKGEGRAVEACLKPLGKDARSEREASERQHRARAPPAQGAPQWGRV